MRRLFFLVPALALAACQSSQGPTYAQDIQPILEGRCVNCHVAGGIAPFALDTWEQARAMAPAIADAVQAGRMPPWRATSRDVQYLRNPSLSEAQKAAVAAWAKDPVEGDVSHPGAALPALGGGIQHVDRELKMPEPYTPSLHPDDYRCFVLKWPDDVRRFVTGVNAQPGVATQVHHIALYLIPPEAADYPVQWDAEDAEPGYSCFGGPFGSRPQQFAVNLLTAWIPGYQGATFPRGGGIAMDPGAVIVMQMHYNLEDIAHPQTDQTTMQFQVADTVERVLAYQPLLDVSWVAGAMDIPAGQKGVLHQIVSDPRSFFSLLGSPLDTSAGFDVEAVMFHMHKLGRRGEVYLERADKTRVQLLDIENWDFHWQNEYQLAEPVHFAPGDKLRVRCTFDNDGPTAIDTNWGEGSDDEMCVANLLSSAGSN